MGLSAFGTHSTVMSTSLPFCSKKKEYSQCILPILTCSSEAWLTRNLERKLGSTQRGMEGKLQGVTWKDKKSVSCTIQQIKVEGIKMTIKKKKLTWQVMSCADVMTNEQPEYQSGSSGIVIGIGADREPHRSEIKAFEGTGGSSQQQRGKEYWARPLSCSGCSGSIFFCLLPLWSTPQEDGHGTCT